MPSLISPVFRVSFAHLVTPQAAAPEAPEKYSMVVVLDQGNKEHVAFLEKLRKACHAVAKDKFGGKVPKGLKNPFRDGDQTDREEWAGCVYFTASCSQDNRPEIVDNELQPLIDPAEIYSGMWIRASLNPYAWNHPTGGKGVSIGLNNVQKIRDDEPFSGGIKASEEFTAWEEDEQGKLF